jgi:lipoprotein-anchoring transpeptidase ErfK/SrfK
MPDDPAGQRPRARRAALVAALALGITPPGAAAAVPEIAAPARAHGATVARLVLPTVARERLAARAPAERLGAQTAWTRQSLRLLVLGSARHGGRRWLRVLLPDRPNGRSGWILRDHALLGRTPYWIDVELGRRRVTVYRDGVVVRRFAAVVGAPATPTPTGLAAVYEVNRQPDPGGFIGPWALALTSLSDAVMEYDGGPGRVAIHGRAGASLRVPLGAAASLGCVRVANGPVSWLARHVGHGTPVDVAP